MKSCEFKLESIVPFGDTDMAGIVHFPNYFKYMENCEHAFFRSLGLSIHDLKSEIGWPRVFCDCKFNQPLRFEDKILTHLVVSEIDQKRIGYTFVIYKYLGNELHKVARGSIKVCCVKIVNEKLCSIEIPLNISSKIKIHEDIE